jgi:hypothetical protein
VVTLARVTFADGNVPRPIAAPPVVPPPRRARKPRRPLTRVQRILGGAVAAVVAVALLAAGAYALGVPVNRWLGLGDDREYLKTPGTVYGDGNLEKTVLPHFGVRLPCGVDDLRWGDSENTGPAGTLYLKFRTTDACLATFLSGNAVNADTVDALPEAPLSYKWHVPDAATFYFGHPDGENDLRVWVDTSDAHPTVWAIAKHY